MELSKFTEKEKNEIINYGFARGKIIFSSIIVALLIGCILGVCYQSIVFLVIFCSLRRYAGGYHADSQMKCYIISFFVVVFSFLGIKHIEFSEMFWFLLQTICLLILLILSPVENANRQLEEIEQKKYKHMTRTMAIGLFALSCFFYYIEYSQIISSIVIAYLLVTILLVLGYIKNYYGKINS